ncbi:hypothetical protein [Nocardioides sp. Soil805]|uniref:hypothetical protein n=1 Tax=Nocardioides sp. Soil805 TaxID=1736416 RepID=UPI000702FD49|nr:hypothetical protein [Nocardioides sp. Soil805]KRF35285.1 hypothetical protein ASG94_14385 [Nocardioides sp. Soil805]
MTPGSRPWPVARLTVWVAALAAVLARFPSAMWPLRPDEAGFLLVARTWAPTPDSLYGPYFVDRPPEVIALIRLTDWLGGPYALRVVGAVGIFGFVLVVAAAARHLASYAAGLPTDRADRVAAWTAVAAAGLVSNAGIDVVSTKGEHLGIPLVAAACWLALLALERRTTPRATYLALASGLVAVLAVGLKQSIVGGLVFGGVLLVGSAVADRSQWRTHARLGAAAALGAAIPVVVTVVWALVAGVDLATLWYAVVGFRPDADAVLAAQPSETIDQRAVVLRELAVETGMALLAAWFLLNLPRLARRMPAPTAAVTTMLAVDVVAVVQSGSYWTTYLVVLVPPVALATALVLSLERLPHRFRVWSRVTTGVTQALVVLVVLSSLDSLWRWWDSTEERYRPVEYYAGEAIGRAARPGDTLVVYGGRADIQWASGLRSPYPHLWSLPMRTLDPDLVELRDLLTGPAAPTWFVEFTALDTWSETGTERIGEELLERYQYVATVCDEYRVYHLKTLERPVLDSRCTEPWREGLASLRD